MRQFIRELPLQRTPGTMYISPIGNTLRLSQTATSGAVPVGGIDRLRILTDVARHATELEVYSSGDGATAWRMETPDARLFLVSAQGKKAAAARWANTRLLQAPLNSGDESPISANPEPLVEAKPDTVRRVEANVEGRDSNVILALREQGYEVGEPVVHPEGCTRVDVRSHDLSAWVSVGQELLDLAAGRVTLDEIKNRQRSVAATARA